MYLLVIDGIIVKVSFINNKWSLETLQANQWFDKVFFRVWNPNVYFLFIYSYLIISLRASILFFKKAFNQEWQKAFSDKKFIRFSMTNKRLKWHEDYDCTFALSISLLRFARVPSFYQHCWIIPIANFAAHTEVGEMDNHSRGNGSNPTTEGLTQHCDKIVLSGLPFTSFYRFYLSFKAGKYPSLGMSWPALS